MSIMPTLPIQPVIKPRDLAGKTNGALPAAMLRSVGPRGELHHLAARAFEALRADLRGQGFHLTYTYGGCFRSYENQKALFLRRYTRDYVAGRNTTSSRRTWEGHRWYKLSGVAAAASPGSSNHGWGLAIDTALDFDLSDGVGPDDAVSIAPALDYLISVAWKYGFSWELQSEPWHIRYITGDAVPAAVLDFERNGGVTVVTPLPADDTLRNGSRGEAVRELQALLNRLNAGPLEEDGHFGNKTETAVRNLEGFLKMTVDGIVDAATLERFVGWENFVAVQPPTFPELLVGSTGVYVSYLQRVLGQCQKDVVVDGQFGPQTERAVRAFQACVKIHVDGRVGPQTWDEVRNVGDGFKVARP